MHNLLLSICIPTYNRYPYLEELVIDLLEQIQKDNLSDFVEIVISDNASTDKSKALFNQLASNKLVKIHQLTKNAGADYNFYNVASKANADYIWWFCSDDLLEDGALVKLVEVLKISECPLYYLGHRLYSKDMKINYGMHPYVTQFSQSIFSGKAGVADFGFMLGYIGAIIIKREQFGNITNHLGFKGTNYVHVAWIIDIMLNQGQRLKLLKDDSFIKHRLGNDSFLNDNYFNRAMIDVIGYRKIGKHYLDNSDFKRFYKNVFKFHLKTRFISIAKSSLVNYIRVLHVNFKYFWSLGVGYEPRYLLSLVFKSPLSIFKAVIVGTNRNNNE